MTERPGRERVTTGESGIDARGAAGAGGSGDARGSAPSTDDPTRNDGAIAALPFDAALEEFQRTVAALEAGGQPLEEALALYERGVALHAHLDRLLTDAELRIRRLVESAGGVAAADVRPDDPLADAG